MSLGLVSIDRGDMPLHTVVARPQKLELDRQDPAILQRRWFSLVHTSAIGVRYYDRAEQWFHRFGVSQIQRRRGTGHLRSHRRGSAVEERVGEGGTGAQQHDKTTYRERNRSF